MEDVSLCSILGVKIVVVTGIEKQVLKRLAKETPSKLSASKEYCLTLPVGM